MIQSVSNQAPPPLNNAQHSSSSANYMYVGPFRLEKTLGKGQTGELNFKSRNKKSRNLCAIPTLHLKQWKHLRIYLKLNPKSSPLPVGGIRK